MAGKKGLKNEMMVILSIDDDREDLEIFYRAVKTVNPLARCLLAQDAREALHLLRDNITPHCIFLDAHMPAMDGREVLTHLKQNERLSDVPVVMYSGRLHPGEAAEYEALGADSFLSKHQDFSGLCSSLAALLNQLSVPETHRTRPL